MSGIFKPIKPKLDLNNPIVSGLVVAVELWEGLGTTTLDLAGNLTGNLTSGPVWNKNPAGVGIDFTAASNQYVAVSSAKILAGLTNSSVLAYFKKSSALDSNLYGERGTAGNDIFNLQARNTENQIQFIYRDDAGTLNRIISGVANPNDSNWHMVGMTKSGTTLQMYFDGAADGGSNTLTATNTLTDATLNARVGNDAQDATKAMDGTILFARGWNRALSATEIALLWQNPWRIYVQPSFQKTLRPAPFKPGLAK